MDGRVRLLVATDPICSRCWATEPALRRLLFHHAGLLDFQRAYGGLLPRWHGFYDPSAGIRRPDDVVPHWASVARRFGQPIDPSVWYEDPLPSSYPPSIALHVVRHLAPAREEVYLRRLRHALFLEARNVAREEVLMACAADVGIDWEMFAAAYQAGAGAASFARELRALRRFELRMFPTIVLTGVTAGRALVLHGAQTYAQLTRAVSVVRGLPLPRERPVCAAEALAAYGTGTLREFAELLQLDDAAAEDALRAAGARVDVSASGQLWRA